MRTPGRIEADLRNEEGYRNHDDILEVLESLESRLNSEKPNITFLGDPRDFPSRPLQKETERFCAVLIGAFRTHFLDLLLEYQKHHPALTPKLIDFLRERDHLLPIFTIATHTPGNALLETYHQDQRLGKAELLVNFEFPLPLAYFWWKGGIDPWGDSSISMDGKVVEWGEFYRALVPLIWQFVDNAHITNSLRFKRINPYGVHDSKNFYYLWAVSNASD